MNTFFQLKKNIEEMTAGQSTKINCGNYILYVNPLLVISNKRPLDFCMNLSNYQQQPRNLETHGMSIHIYSKFIFQQKALHTFPYSFSSFPLLCGLILSLPHFRFFTKYFLPLPYYREIHCIILFLMLCFLQNILPVSKLI